MKSFCDIAGTVGAFVLHDCTYRDFAANHVLAAHLYPERAITIYSFSKWVGIAGLRVGAVIAECAIIERVASFSTETLGSSVLAQRRTGWVGDQARLDANRAEGSAAQSAHDQGGSR
jgi:histidinol-phosphate aminotransferase